MRIKFKYFRYSFDLAKNDNRHFEYDKKLKSNVNIFRILFSYLSEDKTLLKYLEEDYSYMIHQDGMFSSKGVKVDF